MPEAEAQTENAVEDRDAAAKAPDVAALDDPVAADEPVAEDGPIAENDPAPEAPPAAKSLLNEDDLRAALAEVAADEASVASVDSQSGSNPPAVDGELADGAIPEVPAADEGSQDPFADGGVDALAAGGAADGPFEGGSLIPDDDLAAAFAEVEYVAVEDQDAADEPPVPEESPEVDPADAPQVEPGRALRFQIGKQPTVASEPSETSAPSAASDTVAVPTISLGKRLYRAADAVLDLANRPFGFVAEAPRKLIGQIALATLAASMLSAMVIPLIRSDTNAVAFVREKRAELDTAHPSLRVGEQSASQPAETSSDQTS